MNPLPEDLQLPSGWVCKRACADELVLGRCADGFEVVATRTSDADRLPFEPSRGWDLSCRIRVGESVNRRSIGRVSTQRAALTALRSCMERVTELADARSADELSLAVVVQDIHNRCEIPSMTHDRAVSG
jgi:hypothetical protein